ncbi:Aste57867_2974 [Aphanomyces stellatus]|uniref:Aste57867_2974 protein n=1 Tax=Aphanomyces stellatus TaxID=120398 RepID=A0A485K9E5_9STRA|nr:hypothetical protein As57867_002965 [Aphanomyces stellatus]VFT80156.1 Aste57867_2974 [Aphanomyces stellatus]
MKEPRHHEDESRRQHLSTDVLVQIACYIDDNHTFFTFLDALGTRDHRGPLDPLYLLGQEYNRTKLWPCLHLMENMLSDPISREKIEQVLKYYTTVRVCWADKMDWLVRVLQPPITIEWLAPIPSIRAHDWLTKWVQLPVTTMILESSDLAFQDTVETPLAQFFALSSLTLRAFYSAERFFEFVAASSSLVELDILHGLEDTMSVTMLRHLIQWLEGRPVHTLRLWLLPLDTDVDTNLRDAFYTALFQCPIHELSVESYGLRHEIRVFPCSMTRLHLGGSLLTRSTLTRLAEVLPISPHLIHLRLHNWHCAIQRKHGGFDDPATDAIAFLFTKMAESNVTSLALELSPMLKQLNWRQLKWLLCKTKLKRISLDRSPLKQKSMVQLTCALERNNTIRDVNLGGHDLSKEQVVALVNCNLHRTSPIERLHLCRFRTPQDRAAIHALACERGVTVLENDFV